MPERIVFNSMSTPWTILCDFDGTIAVEDVIDSLLVRFGRPGWQVLEDDWHAGRIGSRACMRGQVELLDMTGGELDAHLDALDIDHAFAAFVGLSRQCRVPLRIVSDGLDYAITRILGRHGLAHLPMSANHLLALGGNAWSLQSPASAAGCAAGTCKCAVATRAAQAPARTLLIGDGASDFCAADRADFVFAKNRLIEHCRSAGIPYAPIASFDDAIALLPALLEGRLTDAFTPRTSIPEKLPA